jgi:hypothetical protein
MVRPLRVALVASVSAFAVPAAACSLDGLEHRYSPFTYLRFDSASQQWSSDGADQSAPDARSAPQDEPIDSPSSGSSSTSDDQAYNGASGSDPYR